MSGSDSQHTALDFAIGSVGSIALAIFSVLLLDVIGTWTVLIFAALFVGALISLFTPRKYIGIGILCTVVAIPVLLVGSCFGLFALGSLS